MKFNLVLLLCVAGCGGTTPTAVVDAGNGTDCVSLCQQLAPTCGIDVTQCEQQCSLLTAAQRACFQAAGCDEAAQNACLNPPGDLASPPSPVDLAMSKVPTSGAQGSACSCGGPDFCQGTCASGLTCLDANGPGSGYCTSHNTCQLLMPPNPPPPDNCPFGYSCADVQDLNGDLGNWCVTD